MRAGALQVLVFPPPLAVAPRRPGLYVVPSSLEYIT